MNILIELFYEITDLKSADIKKYVSLLNRIEMSFNILTIYCKIAFQKCFIYCFTFLLQCLQVSVSLTLEITIKIKLLLIQ